VRNTNIFKNSPDRQKSLFGQNIVQKYMFIDIEWFTKFPSFRDFDEPSSRKTLSGEENMFYSKSKYFLCEITQNWLSLQMCSCATQQPIKALFKNLRSTCTNKNCSLISASFKNHFFNYSLWENTQKKLVLVFILHNCSQASQHW
jgi:hypothetical protein